MQSEEPVRADFHPDAWMVTSKNTTLASVPSVLTRKDAL